MTKITNSRFLFLPSVFFAIILVLHSSCSQNNGQHSKTEKTADTLLTPQITIFANLPDSNKLLKIFLKNLPKPQIITVPYSKGFYTNKRVVGEKNNILYPLETNPAPVPMGSFTNYNNEQGYALTNIECGFKDKRGNMWFGTYSNGVSRYDGKTFTTYTTLQGLPHNNIKDIAEDKNGNIWFAGDNGGVSRYDGKSFTIFNTTRGLAQNRVRCIEIDKYGNIWFGTEGKGVSHYDGKKFTTYSQPVLKNNIVKDILIDKKGNIWFAFVNFGFANGGVARYTPPLFQLTADSNKTDDRHFTNFTTQQGLAYDNIGSITEDKKGNLWFGTIGGGASRYTPSPSGKEEEGQFTTFSTAQGLTSNTISSITEDKSGNLWFGTNGNGISRYDGESVSALSFGHVISNYVVRCVFEDKNGNIWFGTSGGGAI